MDGMADVLVGIELQGLGKSLVAEQQSTAQLIAEQVRTSPPWLWRTAQGRLLPQ
jgi:hypothetical protein